MFAWIKEKKNYIQEEKKKKRRKLVLYIHRSVPNFFIEYIFWVALFFPFPII